MKYQNMMSGSIKINDPEDFLVKNSLSEEKCVEFAEIESIKEKIDSYYYFDDDVIEKIVDILFNHFNYV